MTQEEKQLLFKDLCARLPYGVMMKVSHLSHPIALDEFVLFTIKTGKEEGIPYLRPLSSMTEEEEENLREDTGLDIFKCTVNKELEDLWATDCSVKDLFCLYSWLNEHHFDYNGLIEKGLALEAPEDMYKNG